MRADRNTVRFFESVEINILRKFQAYLKEAIEFRGFDRITLDFSQSRFTFAEVMVPLIACVRSWQADGVRFDCRAPQDVKLERLFKNTNWAHLIDPDGFKESRAKVLNNIPAQTFSTIDEQVSIVNELVSATVGELPYLERSHLAALEWALNEITDNTLTHGETREGGVVQLNLHPKSKDIEFVVADAGKGIQNSLRTAPQFATPQFSGPKSDLVLLQEALREGVTRGTGQGNGLFGSSQISALSGGRFHVNSGKAYISLSRGGVSKQSLTDLEFKGTAIVCTINTSTPLLLENSLKMGGVGFSPTDFIEMKYDENDTTVPFKLIEETTSVGSRLSGGKVRNKISFLLRSFPGRKILVDAAGCGIFSSSFADEAFARVQLDIERNVLFGSIGFINISPINQQLFTRSLMQRRISG